MTDDRGGSTHIAVTAPCPATAPTMGVSNAVGGLSAVMVRTHYAGSAIGSAHVCIWRPGSTGPPPVQLVGDLHQARDAAQALARYLNALPVLPPGAVYHCPNDNSASALVVFGYGPGREVNVLAALSGCRFVNNGWRTALAADPLDQVLVHPQGAPLPTTLPAADRATTSIVDVSPLTTAQQP